MAESLVSIVAKVAISSDLKTVWNALTKPSTLKHWFLRHANLDLKVGGSYHFSWGTRNSSGEYPVNMRGKYLKLESERLLQLTWNTEDRPVTFQLDSNETETILTVIVEGFEPGSPGHIFELRGWTFYLINLKTVLEKGWDLRELHSDRTLLDGWVNYYSLR